MDNNITLSRLDTMDVDCVVKDPPESGSTLNDQNDMSRMGKVQEFKVSLKSKVVESFIDNIEAQLSPVSSIKLLGCFAGHVGVYFNGLQNGGFAGLFWSFVWTFFGFGFIIVSLAEMASMAPTSGGQYHWVSEFAPARHQKFLSYTTGWMSVLAWQAGAASGSFLTGTIIQGLISIRDPSYKPQNWQGTLFVFAMIAIIYFFNVHAANWIPRIQNLLLALHLMSWVIVVVVLFVMTPQQPAKVVFTEFYNGGSDATAHMSEEVKDAGRYVPIAIAWGYFGNGILAIIVLVGLLLSIPSVPAALKDSSGFPFLYVFRNTLSLAGVNGLASTILIPVIFSNILFNASTARQTHAFARDKGLPFAEWISHVDRRRRIPVRAIFLSCLISGLLSVINIGSTVAFNAIISLNVAALMYTYAISISCVIYRKIHCPETLPPRRWSMGRLGLSINIIGLVYVCFALFWSFWPPTPSVTAEDFNWSVVIFVGIFILSLMVYAFQGRYQYVGPVVIVQRRE
ncbi:uncharacterized protein N7483_004216 [Penicillium malachiteum]|uniref:uncharacterized protein n=1 Tax=Penicillium malachiteum TaxID=1324776 RepID=UPI002546E928|nr:uncharacterized protein N7483_004216 [Penicillium malachiteum]KAJ5729708.1 hypothetical protein N7483_004216 [Penicillium malachiteum]